MVRPTKAAHAQKSYRAPEGVAARHAHDACALVCFPDLVYTCECTLPVAFYKRTLLRMRLYRDYLRLSRERIQLLLNEGYRNSAPCSSIGAWILQKLMSSAAARGATPSPAEPGLN